MDDKGASEAMMETANPKFEQPGRAKRVLKAVSNILHDTNLY